MNVTALLNMNSELTTVAFINVVILIYWHLVVWM